MEYDVVQGDIAAQSADALVNAAGTSLRMGSGVAGALRRGAGERINEVATAKGPVELGAVAVTDAYDLDATTSSTPPRCRTTATDRRQPTASATPRATRSSKPTNWAVDRS